MSPHEEFAKQAVEELRKAQNYGHAFDICAPIFAEAMREARERCAQICKARAAMLQATADKYPAGTAACFAAEALECERQIRGEG